MQKPTAFLNFEIIRFLSEQTEVVDLLNARDNDPNVISVELRSAFYKKHPTTPGLSSYRIDLIYTTKYPAENNKGDLYIIVEVAQGEPAKFEVVSINPY